MKSNKWTVVALSFVLDTCRINASTIVAMNDNKDPRKVNSLDFEWQLSEALVMPFIQQHPLVGLNISTQRKMEIILGRPLRAPPATVAEVNHDAKSDTPPRRRHCIQVSHGQGHNNVKEWQNVIAMRLCFFCYLIVCYYRCISHTTQTSQDHCTFLHHGSVTYLASSMRGWKSRSNFSFMRAW